MNFSWVYPLTSKTLLGYFVAVLLLVLFLSKTLSNESNEPIKPYVNKAEQKHQELKSFDGFSLKDNIELLKDGVVVEGSAKNVNKRLLDAIEPEVTQPNLTRLEYDNTLQYNEDDEPFFNQPHELQEGQYRVILDNEPLLELVQEEESSDKGNYKSADLEQGQYNVVLKSDESSDIIQPKNGDKPMVGDPYYLEPGQYRIILQ